MNDVERARIKLARIEARAGEKRPQGYLQMLIDEERRAEIASAIYDGRRYET